MFRERLTPPVSWWLLALVVVASCGVAVGAYVGPTAGTVAALVAAALSAAVLAASTVTVRVTETHLVAGRARIEHRFLGPARALGGQDTRERSGPGADARAYLVLRPYVATSVEVRLDDAADPVPYWLISSRRPDELVSVLQLAGAGHVPDVSS